MRAGVATALALGALVASIATGSAAAGAGKAANTKLLALMPLPKAAFGSAAASLPIAQDSGVVSNSAATLTTTENVPASRFAKLGRLTGYTLDYGSSIPVGQGVTEAQTTVELYKSSADASAGLAFWRHDDGYVTLVEAAGIAVKYARFAPGGVGKASIGDVGSITMKGEPTLYGADVDFQVGSLVALVSISSERSTLARPLAEVAARKLLARIRAVQAGRIRGPSVALPAKAKAGPPAHGPSLAAVALTATDVGKGKVTHQGYVLDPTLHALSAYVRVLLLSGDVGFVQEEVALYRTTAQAAYELTLRGDFDASPKAWENEVGIGQPLSAYAPKAVTIRVGQGSRAVLGVAKLANGRSLYLGILLLRVGRTLEYITMATSAPVKLLPTAVDQLASIALDRAESGLAGATTATTPATTTTTTPTTTPTPTLTPAKPKHKTKPQLPEA